MRARGLDQPLEGIKAVASLGGAAIVLWIVYAFDEYLDLAANDAPGGHGGVVANEWLNIGLDVVLPGTFLLLVFFGLVAQALLGSRYA